MHPMTTQEEKPNGRQYGWYHLETEYPYDFRLFRVREDTVRWPDGHVRTYAYVEAHGAVWVVPVTPEGHIILIRQFRYTVDDWCWEIPAGGFHDFEGDPIALARRELAEEVGGSSDDWQYVSRFRPGVSVLDEVCHIVLARDVRLDREPAREPGELIQVHRVEPARAMEMARGGEMVEGHSALALLRCEPYLR
jgi:ADP-ribose pyrophosphatase